MDFSIFKEKSQGSADFVRGQHLARNSKNPAVHTAFHRCIAQQELKQSWRGREETRRYISVLCRKTRGRTGSEVRSRAQTEAWRTVVAKPVGLRLWRRKNLRDATLHARKPGRD